LPNRDVVIPQVLIERARKARSTTRGAALRVATGRPEAMPCGEEWGVGDWDGFEETQRKGAERARRGTTP